MCVSGLVTLCVCLSWGCVGRFVCMYVYGFVCVSLNPHVCLWRHVGVFAHVSAFWYPSSRVDLSLCVCVALCVCVPVFMSVCMYACLGGGCCVPCSLPLPPPSCFCGADLTCPSELGTRQWQ